MKKLALTLPVFIMLGLCGCRSVEERPRLELLSSIRIVGGDAIRITEILNSPFFLVGPDGKQSSAVIINKGEQFVLSDGYHVAYAYTFRDLMDGKIVFEEEERVDTRSMGGAVRESRRIVIVPSY